jgi:hypothetical protein
MMWILITVSILVVFAVAVGVYYYLNRVPYPNCSANWDIRFPVGNKFETPQDLINNLSSRFYELGTDSYAIFVKDWNIGSVNNGLFYPSDEYKSVTAGTYMLTPISKTNTCQSGAVIIEKCMPTNIACRPAPPSPSK